MLKCGSCSKVNTLETNGSYRLVSEICYTDSPVTISRWLASKVISNDSLLSLLVERGGGNKNLLRFKELFEILCPDSRHIGGGQGAFLASAASQLPSAQNNFYVKEIFWGDILVSFSFKLCSTLGFRFTPSIPVCTKCVGALPTSRAQWFSRCASRPAAATLPGNLLEM